MSTIYDNMYVILS